MALIGLLTSEGIAYTNSIRNKKGYFIYPTKYGVSAAAGILNISRTLDSINTEWFTGLISGYNALNDNVLEIVGIIPANSNGGVATSIAEIYYYGESESSEFTVNTSNNQITIADTFIASLFSTGDRITIRVKDTGILPTPIVEAQTYYVRKVSALVVTLHTTKADAISNTNIVDILTSGSGNLILQKEFMLGLAQPIPAIPYYPDMGNYALRPSIVVANSGDPSLFQFIYTQSFDIENHNLDSLAHPAIQAALNKTGIFILPSQYDYKGQPHDEDPTFEAGVSDLKPVYMKANGEYGLAQANGTIKELNFIGFRQDDMVKSSGYVNIGTHGFTSGIKIYLSPTTAGLLTSTGNNTEVGIVINSNTILLTKQYTPTISSSTSVAIQDEGSPIGNASAINFIGATVVASAAVGGVVNVTVSSSFQDLTDTPTFSGEAGKVPVVNPGETALVFAEYKDTLLKLNDTPNSYLGQGGKVVKVNSVETGIEFVANPNSYFIYENFDAAPSQIDLTYPDGSLPSYSMTRYKDWTLPYFVGVNQPSGLQYTPHVLISQTIPNSGVFNWGSYTGDKKGAFLLVNPGGLAGGSTGSYIKKGYVRHKTLDTFSIESTILLYFASVGPKNTIKIGFLPDKVGSGGAYFTILADGTGTNVVPGNPFYSIRGTVYDGTTEVFTTSISVTAGSTVFTLQANLRLVKLPTGDVEFYVDNSLLGTVSVGIPDDKFMTAGVTNIDRASYTNSDLGFSYLALKNFYVAYNNI